jgi:hypothetical protein
MRGLFRPKKPQAASKNQKTARQRNSTQEASTDTGLEMANLQLNRGSSNGSVAMTLIPSDFMAMMQNERTPRGPREISSGFVMLENSMQAITFDPRMASRYYRKDVKIVLGIIFILKAAIALSSGIVIWIESFYALSWTILPIGAFSVQVGKYLYFGLAVIQKARRFKKKPYMMRPMGGIRAPRASINETFL